MNSACPQDVTVSGRISTAQVVVNEHTQTFVVVTQKRVGACLATYSQRFPRGGDRQRQHGNGLKCLCVLGQCTVVRDQWNIESQLQCDRTRIAKAPSGNERHAHALFARVLNCEAIALGNTTAGIEECPIEIKSQKTYRHKDKHSITRGLHRSICAIRAICSAPELSGPVDYVGAPIIFQRKLEHTIMK